MAVVTSLIRKVLLNLGFEVHRVPSRRTGDGSIPDAVFYRPIFSPWLGYGEFAERYQEVSPYTLVSADRCWILFSLARQALAVTGDLIECGVYKGGTAILLSRVLSRHQTPETKRLLLFDSFKGMEQTDKVQDLHHTGDFADTSLEAVKRRLHGFGGAEFFPGWIPASFQGLEKRRFAFAHVDVDLHQSVIDCCTFIYPRLSPGGFMIFDDYGFPSCPGARAAVDAFFKDKPEVPLVLPTGQALIFKESSR